MEVNINHKTTDIYGEVTAGWLKLLGWPKALIPQPEHRSTSTSDSDSDLDQPRFGIVSHGRAVLGLAELNYTIDPPCQIDTSGTDELNPFGIYFLPVRHDIPEQDITPLVDDEAGEHDGRSVVTGLLIRATGTHHGEYERIGIAQLGIIPSVGDQEVDIFRELTQEHKNTDWYRDFEASFELVEENGRCLVTIV